MTCTCRACLITAHDFASNNRDASGLCGCFYCLQTFDASEIVEWIDGGSTALCPRCKLDSVLPGNKVYIGPELLTAMRKLWFETFGGLNDDAEIAIFD